MVPNPEKIVKYNLVVQIPRKYAQAFVQKSLEEGYRPNEALGLLIKNFVDGTLEVKTSGNSI